MRILLLTDYSQLIGGDAVYTAHISAGLEARGHTVRAVGGSSLPSLSKIVTSWFDPRYIRPTQRLLDSFEPDVVLSHSIYYNVSPSVLVPMKNVPVVFIPPDPTGLRYPDVSPRTAYKGLLYPKVFTLRTLLRRYVDAFIAQSQTIVEHLNETLAPFDQPVYLLPHPSFWDPIDESELNSTSTDRIFYAGRLMHDKGVDSLLEAFAQLAEERSEMELVLAGGGPLKSPLEARAAQLGLENVRFLGRIPHSAVKQQYRKADVTVLPSIDPESFGLVIIESMSQGTPVITTNNGAQAELVTDGVTGYTYPPGDVDELVRNLRTMLTGDHEEMAKNCLQKASQYSMKSHLEDLEKILTAVRLASEQEEPPKPVETNHIM